MSARPRIVVLGSAHVDLIARAARLPSPGASVLGEDFRIEAGGKAANQAIACARAGAETRLIARLGADAFGDLIAARLAEAAVGLEHVTRDAERATGASTVLAAQGEYASIIVPGAAGALDDADIARAAPDIARAGALLLQLELPVAISARAAALATEAGASVTLNLSPIAQSSDALALARSAATLVVNAAELAALIGRPGAVSRADAAAALEAAARLAPMAEIVVTFGAEGAAARTTDGVVVTQTAFPTTLVDSVGAGDAFLAAYARARLERRSLADALRRAAAAGAIAVSRAGAASAPTRAELDAFLARA